MSKRKFIILFFPEIQDSENYHMDHPQRGKAFNSNHEYFDPILCLTTRPGTAEDREKLCLIAVSQRWLTPIKL
jgi:hypothetical protein